MNDAESVRVDLPPDEFRLLTFGLANWGGPAYCTDAMARAMGFVDAETMLVDIDRFSRDLKSTHALTAADWTRALLAVEVVFASDVVGAAFDWQIVSGWTDEQTIGVLRRLQASLRKVRKR